MHSVGSAAICINFNYYKTKSINLKVSTYTTKRVAINDAMDIVLFYQPVNALIFTDSYSVLRGINNCNSKININSRIYDIRKKYKEFVQNNSNSSQSFYWIPSHRGIKRNEIVDNLAKLASKLVPTENSQVRTQVRSQLRFMPKCQVIIFFNNLFKIKYYYGLEIRNVINFKTNAYGTLTFNKIYF